MRNRDGRSVILPLLAVLFTSLVSFRAATVAAAAGSPGTEPAPGGGASDGGAGTASPTPTPASSPAAPATGTTAAAPKPAAGIPVAADAAFDAAAKLPPAAPAERKLVPSLSHDLQFGLALLPGGGYHIVFPYKNSLDCGDLNNNMARVCTNRSPFFLDLQPSFGISESWDFLLDLRFGLEQNVFLHHEVFLMPGFRYWLDPQNHVKFFTTLQLAYDATKQSTTAVSSSDLGIRNSNGLMIEIMRNFGVYFQFGETIGFIRWLSFGVDAGVGVQARIP